MSISNRMDYLEEVYDAYNGKIHKIMNRFDLDGEDFEYLVELKAYRNE